jgi:type II secretory pathway predicted ATPase ExeA
MYEEFYNLKESPFSLLPDPAYLYMSRQHEMALTLLKYSLIKNHAYTVITGEVGSGKTTLINQLLGEIGENFTVGLINFTDDRVVQLLPWMLQAFDLPYENMSAVKMYDRFVEFLVEEHEKDRVTILIVDEAQNLAVKALENLRMFSNVNANETLLQIILVGQPEFRSTLERPEFRQLNQRVSTYYRLDPLSQEEAQDYISHRIDVAGGDKNLFSTEAVEKIWRQSGGIPRAINTLCDMSLVYGFANDHKTIDDAVVEEMLGDRREFAVEAGTLEQTDRKSNGNGAYGGESLFEKLIQIRN